MVPEAPLEPTENGLVPKGDGWFVLNARDVGWQAAEGRGAYGSFEGEPEFGQVGIHLVALEPGDAWRCTTGRSTRRTSSCSPARHC